MSLLEGAPYDLAVADVIAADLLPPPAAGLLVDIRHIAGVQDDLRFSVRVDVAEHTGTGRSRCAAVLHH